MENRDHRIRGILYALVTITLWGFQAIFLKLSTDLIDPATVSWFRFLIAFVILFVYYLIRKPSFLRIIINPPFILVVAAFGLAINYVAFITGIKMTSPNIATLVIQLGPISLGMVGFFFFKEKLSYRQAIGFMLAGVGLLLFYIENLQQISGDSSNFRLGVLLVAISAMSWVVYAVFQKQLIKYYAAGELNLFIFGLPILLILPFVHLNQLTDLSFSGWALLIYLGLNTLVAYGCLTMAFKYLEASKISVMITLNPIITFITMGILTYLEVSWIEPEYFSVKIVATASLVLTGAFMAVAFTRPEKKKDIREFFGRKRY